jgi:hypothetical protein
MYWLLLFLPVTIALEHAGTAPIPLIFFFAALAIVPVAAWIVRSTEQLAARTDDTAGGLLNAAFGNTQELIIDRSSPGNRRRSTLCRILRQASLRCCPVKRHYVGNHPGVSPFLSAETGQASLLFRCFLDHYLACYVHPFHCAASLVRLGHTRDVT